MQKNNLNTEKIAFKVIQMKSLGMRITNQKNSFDIFTVVNFNTMFCWQLLHATYDWFCARVTFV